MAEDQQVTPKLSERFSGLFGVEDASLEPSVDSSPKTIYLEESRKLNLNKLLHLAPYSEVLLVLGEPAVGRTSLLKAFVERAATTWRISFVTATALMDGVSFLRQVGRGFDHDLDDVDSTMDLLWELDRYLQALARSGRRAIIIVDDAHLLTDDVILLAEKILRDERSDSSVSLILSMRKDQASKLNRFALLKERLAYTLMLEPFSPKEVDGYLRHRMKETVPQLNELLSPELVADIHRKSGGLPEEINALAHGVLTKKDKSSLPNGDRGPLLKLVALALAAVVIGSVLYFQDEINQMFALPVESDRAVDEEFIQPDSSIASDVPDASDAQVLMAMDAAQQGQVVTELEDAEGVPVPDVVTGLADDDLPPADAELASQLPVAAEETVGVAVVTEPPVGVDEVVVTESESTPIVEKPDIAPEIIAKTDVLVMPQPAPVLEPPAKVEARVAPELEWLMAQPGKHYTMQLMALVDKDKVLRFVKNNNIADQSATYPITRRGKILTVLVYGSYANRAEASEAAKALPKSWGVSQPWVRSFTDARGDLK